MKKMEYVIGFGLGCIGTATLVILMLKGEMPSMISVFRNLFTN